MANAPEEVEAPQAPVIATKTDITRLYVRVRDINKVVYEGYIKALSSINDKGPFDILPYHANFISIIREGITLHKEDGTTQQIPVDAAVLKNLNNMVQVYLGIKAV